VKKFFTDLGYMVLLQMKLCSSKLMATSTPSLLLPQDDFTLVIADSTESANLLIQKQLTERFEISDLGPISWLLGVSITRDINTCNNFVGQQSLH